jgi:hypothetical protein
MSDCPRLAATVLCRRVGTSTARIRTAHGGKKETVMATYGKTAQSKVKKVMEERKKGTLKSGSGKKVTSRKQAIAIGLSEARKAGAKVPRKK